MFFKINVPEESSTGDEPQLTTTLRLPNPIWSVLELSVAVLLLIAWGGVLPGVNETHYLVKAKGFWDANFCPDDLFVHAPASHWLFYVAFGWLTQFFSLGITAFVGRLLIAVGFAYAWKRLAQHILAVPGFSILSLALFLVLNDRFHLAGEWIIGGVESKSFAYVFVLLALDAMAGRQWGKMWLMVGCASAFHVLVGGWAAIALAISRILTGLLGRRWSAPADSSNRRREAGAEIWMLGLGAAISLIGILPPLLTNLGSAPNLTAQASQIYVKERIAHHLDFSQFSTERVARFAVLLSFWFVASRLIPLVHGLRQLNWFCCGALILSLAGLILSALADGNPADSSAGLPITLLRLYWFRLADFALPLVTSLLVCVQAYWLLLHFRKQRQLFLYCCFGSLIALIVAATSLNLAMIYGDGYAVASQRSLPKYETVEKRQAAYRNWRRVCLWIRENTPQDASFITPTQQQSFKWYAHRTEYVNWKDIPQQNESILEWKRRIDRVSRPQQSYSAGLLAFNDSQLKSLAEEYDIDYLLVLQKEADLIRGSTKLKQVYPEDPQQRTTYAVFQLR